MRINKKIFSIIIAALLITTILPKDIVHAAQAGRIWYVSQVQDAGWQGVATDGQTSGTVGWQKRLETIRIAVDSSVSYTVDYQVHVQNKGWMEWCTNGQNAGTIGESLRLEAIKIKLRDKVTGVDPGVDVFYRVHVENIGWMPWKRNGEIAGTVGQSLRVEAIEIQIRTKGDYPNTSISYSGQAIVDQARAHKSLVTYVYGADDQANHIFDCSSFTRHIFAHQGVYLVGNTWAQMTQGVAVSQANLQAGDLVFTESGNHVGIYTSDGNMIHNSEEGVNVRESKIYGFYAARRIQ